MDLERCAGALRPRRKWEAVDLGFALARRFWKPMWGALWLTSWPVCLISLVVAWKAPFWGFLIAWWLRPFFDRLPLFVISRSFFGAPPNRADLRAAWWPWWSNGFFSDLTWRRFDPQRSYLAPIQQLEGASGRVKERRAIFQGRGEIASGLTVLCLIAELALFLAAYALVEMLVPGGLIAEELGEDTLEWHPAYSVLLVALAWGSFLTIEPFYVAAGFALYLQRRVESEGWDIELAFRRLQRRLSGPRAEEAAAPPKRGFLQKRRTAQVAALALAAWCCLATPAVDGPVWAAEAAVEREPDSKAHVRETLGEVLADPVFGDEHQEKRWVWRFEGPDEDTPGPPTLRLPGMALLGALIRLLGLLVLVGALAFLLIKIASSFRGGTALPDVAIAAARVGAWNPAGPGGSPLPSDVLAAALELVRAGRLEEAMSLLYRGALAALVERGALPERTDFTEGECVDHLRRHKQAGLAQALGALVLCWQRAAYGHRPLELAEVQGLLELYRHHFVSRLAVEP